MIQPDSLFSSYPDVAQTPTGLDYFLRYLNILEGAKTRIKNLHWAAQKLPVNEHRGAHLYLDNFLDIVSDFQDTVAESSQGILGHMGTDDITGTPIRTSNVSDLLKYITSKTIDFYDNMPAGTIYVGIKSETETFIKDLNKYKYLFELTD